MVTATPGKDHCSDNFYISLCREAGCYVMTNAVAEGQLFQYIQNLQYIQSDGNIALSLPSADREKYL